MKQGRIIVALAKSRGQVLQKETYCFGKDPLKTYNLDEGGSTAKILNKLSVVNEAGIRDH